MKGGSKFYFKMMLCCTMVSVLQASGHGTFCKPSTDKKIRISFSSQTFLQNIIGLEQQIHDALLGQEELNILILSKALDVSSSLMGAEWFTPSNKKILNWILKQEMEQFLLLSKRSGDALLGIKNSVQFNNAMNDLFLLVQKALQDVNARGFEKDLSFVKSCVNRLNVCNGLLDCATQLEVLKVLIAIQMILTEFDGVCINDYDVIVLFHVSVLLWIRGIVSV